MQKINGYTEEEAKELIEFVDEGKKQGHTLTALFEAYGKRRGRARGSVRNYYYALMKNQGGDERIVKLLDGKQLSVGKIRAFTEEEADEAIRSILREKAKGVSSSKKDCRNSLLKIYTLAGGDDKLMLRLQNKYRNTLKNAPEKIAAIEMELFGRELPKSKKKGGVSATKGDLSGFLKRSDAREILQKRLEEEINELYDRLTQALKAENARLAEENEALRLEIQRLQKRFS